MRLVLLGLIFFVSFIRFAFASSYIYPIFPDGGADISTAARILFQTQYPVNMDLLRSSSPYVVDDNGNFISSHYLVVPSEHLDDPLVAFYSVECELYVSENNLVTILPYRPFNYNTTYSVVFINFPLMVPDISSPNGYYNYSASGVFEDYFTTISFPLNFEVSFEKTHNFIWCDNAISVEFTKPIYPDDMTLLEMFTIVDPETGSIISVDVELSEDGLTANLFPSADLSGGVYFLQTNLSGYTGDENLDRSYRFAVSREMTIVFKSNVDPNYRNSQYGYYSTFKYGDTIYFNSWDFLNDGEYVFSGWDLPGEKDINYMVDEDGMLKIIFDCDNYFYKNSLTARQITLTANYIYNPIDTLVLSFTPSNLQSLCDPDFYLYYELEGSLGKVVDVTNNSLIFTYRKYSSEMLRLFNLYHRVGCEIEIDNIDYPLPDGDIDIDTSGGGLDIERPLAPDANYVMENGMVVHGSRLGLSVTLNEKRDCVQASWYGIYVNFVGEDRDIFLNGDVPLDIDSRNMFSVFTIDNVNVLGSANFPNDLYTDDYKVFSRVAYISIFANSVSYNIEIAPEYQDLYEIYNVVQKRSDEFKDRDSKDWYRVPDVGFSSTSGIISRSSSYCYMDLFVQLRRKIISLDILVSKENQATSVPTYNQVHLQYLDNKPLKVDGTKILNNGLIENSIYGMRYTPEVVQVSIDGYSMKVVQWEKTRYYFYAGERISAEPFVRKNTGYDFERWVERPVGSIPFDSTDGFEVTFNAGIKNYQGEMFLSEGFRLEYIWTQKQKMGGYGDANWDVWAFDKESNREDIDIRGIWQDNNNPDFGVGMQERSGTTTAIRFEFNRPLNTQSFRNNVSVTDEKVWNGDNKRYDDSVRVGSDVIRYEYDNANWSILGSNSNRFHFVLDNPYGICHMLPFKIKINNPSDDGIISSGSERLTNVYVERELLGVTMTPNICIQTVMFRNQNMEQKHVLHKRVRVKIVGSLFVDTEGETPPHRIENEFVIVDEEGKHQFKYENKKYPSLGGTEPIGKGSDWYHTGNFYTSTNHLLYNNRVMCSFHWFEDKPSFWGYFSLIDVIVTGAKALAVVSDIFDLGISSAVTDAVQKLGEAIKGDTNDDEVKYRGHNTFYLGFNDIKLNSTYSRDGEKYDWFLWGVGKTGMYKTVIKEAYSPSFKHNGLRLISQTDNVTQLEITIGNVW